MPHGAGSERDDRGRGWACRIRRAPTCSRWPATPRGTRGCPARSASAHLRGGSQGTSRLRRALEQIAERRPTATGWCSPAAERERSASALDGPGGVDVGAPRAVPSSSRPVRPGQRRRRAHPRTRSARRRALRGSGRVGRRARACDLVATTAAHYHGPPRRPLATAMAAVRARSSLDERRRLATGVVRVSTCARGDEMLPPASPAGRRRCPTRRRLGEGDQPSRCQLIAPDLPPFPCPAGPGPRCSYLRQPDLRGRRANSSAGKPHEARAYDMHRARAADHRRAQHFPGYFLVVWEIARSSAGRQRHSVPRAGAAPRTPRSVTRCGSPPSTPSTTA